MLVLIYLAFVAVAFYWQAKKVKAGKSTIGKAIGTYAAYAIAPVILYGAAFFALVGLEELTHTAIIGEGYARSLLFVIAGGVAVVLLATLVFSLVVLAMKRKDIDAT
jgi:hypothetical protein